MFEEVDMHDYHKVIEPLREVRINNLFARSVIENKIEGKVYVDDVTNPQTFYVVHKYGMSLLFGTHDNEYFNKSFLRHALNLDQSRNSFLWLQAFPEPWNKTLENLFSEKLIASKKNSPNEDTGIIELNTRLNFTFNYQKYLGREKIPLPQEIRVVRTNREHYNEMTGSVIPSFFWNNVDEFLSSGVGFSLLHKGNLAAMAYAGFILDNNLEIGIETIPEFRKRGYAEIVCTALIDYCIANNFIPVWSCRLENVGSVKLAEKLGFEISRKIPYYRLSS